MKPTVGRFNLVGKGCGPKNLRNKGVRIERNRRHQLLQLCSRQRRTLFRVSGFLQLSRRLRRCGLCCLLPTTFQWHSTGDQKDGQHS